MHPSSLSRFHFARWKCVNGKYLKVDSAFPPGISKSPLKCVRPVLIHIHLCSSATSSLISSIIQVFTSSSAVTDGHCFRRPNWSTGQFDSLVLVACHPPQRPMRSRRSDDEWRWTGWTRKHEGLAVLASEELRTDYTRVIAFNTGRSYLAKRRVYGSIPT